MSRRSVVKLLAGAGAAACLPKVLAQTAPAATASAPAGAGGRGRGAAPADPAGSVIPPAPEYIAAPPDFGVAEGPFKPTWDSLSNYSHPAWYRDAKLGLWAHWGPQCQPEMGDWYAQKMYQFSSAPNSVYQFHCRKYGHPSKFGWKDVLNEWKAEKWDPAHLLNLYKKAGAKFFSAMANHHDNMDMWDSKYQPWNTVNVGPRKSIIAGWEKAAREAGLRFGLSCHGDRAWDWLQVARDADPSGDLAGVPYDGFVTKADGKGKWWEGLDPQHLYAQYHQRGRYQWSLSGTPALDPKYVEKFFNRVIDLIDKHKPDLLYFDDTVLPIYPASDIGLRIAAYLYNTNLARLGRLEAVMTGKGLNAQQRRAITLDVERGVTNGGETLPWQTDTCIGSWHYERAVFDNHRYKTAKQVVQMLIDIVAKNGTLMLSIPLKGDGTLDADELKVLDGLASWIAPNGEGIYATRPWAVYGEGPSTSNQARGQFGGARDVGTYTAEDFRFTKKGDVVYAFLMAWPAGGKASIKSLAAGSPNFPQEIARVELLGAGQVNVERTSSALVVALPDQKPNDFAVCLKITPK
ncbi:MAG TPA: alpha-L-fucosidase [Phycisphaerae bacterium]|nr:alpha-L-fucosidase [Phycisphaerae bacterium]